MKCNKYCLKIFAWANFYFRASITPDVIIFWCARQRSILWIQLCLGPLPFKCMWMDVSVRRRRECARHNELSVWALWRRQPDSLANLTPCTRQLFLCRANMGGEGQRGRRRGEEEWKKQKEQTLIQSLNASQRGQDQMKGHEADLLQGQYRKLSAPFLINYYVAKKIKQFLRGFQQNNAVWSAEMQHTFIYQYKDFN